jgi:hypothetical protein
MEEGSHDEESRVLCPANPCPKANSTLQAPAEGKCHRVDFSGGSRLLGDCYLGHISCISNGSQISGISSGDVDWTLGGRHVPANGDLS